MAELRAGDIVRVSYESMHWDFFIQENLPLEGVLLEVDEDMEPEDLLVEFYEQREDFHDGGWGDGKRIRYWMDKLDLIESGAGLFRIKDRLPHEDDPAWLAHIAPPRPARVEVNPPPMRVRVGDLEPQEVHVQWFGAGEHGDQQREQVNAPEGFIFVEPRNENR